MHLTFEIVHPLGRIGDRFEPGQEALEIDRIRGVVVVDGHWRRMYLRRGPRNPTPRSENRTAGIGTDRLPWDRSGLGPQPRAAAQQLGER